MDTLSVLYLVLIGLFNFGVIAGYNILRKKYNTGIKQQLVHSLSYLIFFIVGLGSVILILRIFNFNLIEILGIELFKIGDKVPIDGFLLFFLFSTFAILIFSNRFLNRLIGSTRDYHAIPKKVTIVVRRWLSFIVFLILMKGVVSLTNHSFSFFTIGLFKIQKIEITIGLILQSLFMAYTVHAVMLISEHFYNRRIKRTGIDTGKGHTVFQIVKYFAWVITIVVIVGSTGISVTVLLAGSAALFVGLGFGIQSLFNDFVSGLIILFEGTLRVNDIVELENGIIGRVQEIGLRTSKMLTRDNIVTIIPNNNFVGKNVINWSYNEHKTRFNVQVGVAYGSDVRLVEKVLIDCALEHEKIHRYPEPFVFFKDFGDSSLDFSLYFWIDESFLVEKVRSDLRFAINDKFKENNIEIPFPQRDLHIRSGLNKDI